MTKHSFDVEIACKVGANAAAVYEYIRYWCARNAKAGKNEHNGEFWMFCSLKGFTDQFPYLTKSQVRVAIDKLVEAQLVKVGEFNRASLDHTAWYTTCEKSHVDVLKIARRCAKNSTSMCDFGTTIPIKEHNLRTQLKDNNPLTPFDEVLNSYPVIVNSPELKQTILDYMENRKALKSPIKTERALKLNINEAIKLSDGDPSVMKAIFEQSIRNGWKGVFALKTNVRQAQVEQADTNPFRAIKMQEGRI